MSGPRSDGPLVQARGLTKTYRVARGWLQPAATVQALADLDFDLDAGRTLAVVGESGCGKSTLARALTLVERPDAGTLRLGGQVAVGDGAAPLRSLRPQVQMVFQNPYASLNPRKRIGATLDEPLALNTPLTPAQRRERVLAALAQVGLADEHAQRWPHMFSGGQRQRVAIARAMILNPRLLVADEPTSALDVSIQAQILNLFMDLQQASGVALVFISHNLSVVEHVADRVMVMYLGRAVELAPKAALFGAPRHPYTQALLSATPSLHAARRGQRITLPGEPPSALAPPSGCAFHPRCARASARCREERPALQDDGHGHAVACHHAG
jgi:dipeptide transport system ATP-binding protein